MFLPSSTNYAFEKIGVDTTENELLNLVSQSLKGIWKCGGGETPAQITNTWNLKCEPSRVPHIPRLGGGWENSEGRRIGVADKFERLKRVLAEIPRMTYVYCKFYGETNPNRLRRQLTNNCFFRAAPFSHETNVPRCLPLHSDDLRDFSLGRQARGTALP